MKYSDITHFQSGVSLPLSGLWSTESVGIGEYPDLMKLATWAHECEMDLIQLLPLNDTGEQSSPYSALSAFALNPTYLRLGSIPGFEAYKEELADWKSKYNTPTRIDYSQTYRFKINVLRDVFEHTKPDLLKDSDLHTWIQDNSWVRVYSVYRMLKKKNNQASWIDWTELRDPSTKEIDQLWVKNYESVLFYAWIQYWCEKQFQAAAQDCEAIGVKIKGDIPILISEDSADVWGHRQLFDMNNRAGAPPDMFCTDGQNWRFPCYKWDVLKASNYQWWKDRLQQASKFYHAFRIDHVLGFFRIWQTPEKHNSGMLGRFIPSQAFKVTELQTAGFHEGQILHWTNPSYSVEELQARGLDPLTLANQPFFEGLFGNTTHFKLRSFLGENELKNLDEQTRNNFLRLMSNRIFNQYEENPSQLYPFWYWYESDVYKNESPEIQERIRQVLGDKEQSQDQFWGENGHGLLKMMRDETDMLVCAEDLGVVPNCVAPTLANLNILSLKIERWARNYHEAGDPYIPVEEYPRLSVCSPACHDTSNLRLWWDEKDLDVEQYKNLLGWDELPDYLTDDLAYAVVARNLSANSLIAILPLQDWLSIDYDLRSPTSEEERINIPGTQNDTNWNWRMAVSLDELENNSLFIQKMKNLILIRKSRPL